MMDFKKNVVYYFDGMIGTYHYAVNHPMKPLRVAMTDEIVKKYQLNNHFDEIVSLPSFRIINLPKFITCMPRKKPSLLFTRISMSM